MINQADTATNCLLNTCTWFCRPKLPLALIREFSPCDEQWCLYRLKTARDTEKSDGCGPIPKQAIHSIPSKKKGQCIGVRRWGRLSLGPHKRCNHWLTTTVLACPGPDRSHSINNSSWKREGLWEPTFDLWIYWLLIDSGKGEDHCLQLYTLNWPHRAPTYSSKPLVAWTTLVNLSGSQNKANRHKWWRDLWGKQGWGWGQRGMVWRYGWT